MAAPREMRRLLVANRGEIARRVMRTARSMGIATVAVHSDIDADEPFVREADQAVSVGGASAAESYLRTDLIIRAAQRVNADAIHPGYGFLAENAAFARACADAGVTFVGPTPQAIEAMGSKLAAKRRLAVADIPLLPDVDATGLEGDRLVRAAAQLGYPLLIKPSMGGGGKGMRIVRDPGELERSVAASRREAAGAFGDNALLLERYIEGGRHVEIQILGDLHGTVTYIGERECSVQRRHQKILEESPSVAVDAELRARMGRAAVRVGEAIGYVGAGTVEFLLVASGEFHFLEVNTRLQVEHPVTEAVTGVDLVRAQLEIAAGAPVPQRVRVPPISGHAIEARLYAEDPAADFLPQTGTIEHLLIPPGEGIRVDAGVEAGSRITVHYDPMIAKVIAHAPSRTEARRRLAQALRGAEIDGVRTNRDFLVRLLEDPAFAAGEFDTQTLENGRATALSEPLADTEHVRGCAAAAAIAAQTGRRARASVQRTLPSGWRNNPSEPQRQRYTHKERAIEIAYRLGSAGHADLSVDGRPLPARIHAAGPDQVELELAGVRTRYRVRTSTGGAVHVNTHSGQCDLRELDRYPSPTAEPAPGSLLAPMPGAVIRLDAAAGDRVKAGQPLLVLEAMKMEHEILAPTDGLLVELPVAVGSQVTTGTLLAAIE
jgi:propionyl-CoA carboxylase alpha chain